jgi:hypothetical protein
MGQDFLVYAMERNRLHETTSVQTNERTQDLPLRGLHAQIDRRQSGYGIQFSGCTEMRSIHKESDA